jgi:hypothetical protein
MNKWHAICYIFKCPFQFPNIFISKCTYVFIILQNLWHTSTSWNLFWIYKWHYMLKMFRKIIYGYTNEIECWSHQWSWHVTMKSDNLKDSLTLPNVILSLKIGQWGHIWTLWESVYTIICSCTIACKNMVTEIHFHDSFFFLWCDDNHLQYWYWIFPYVGHDVMLPTSL